MRETDPRKRQSRIIRAGFLRCGRGTACSIVCQLELSRSLDANGTGRSVHPVAAEVQEPVACQAHQ